MFRLIAVGLLLFQAFVSARDATAGIPYHASVRDGDTHLASAAILNKRWIITTAHTIVDLENYDNLKVVVGINRINATGDNYKVYSVKIYPKYDRKYILKYDVALLNVEKDIKFGLKVKSIDLPSADIKTGANVEASGYKLKNDLGQTPVLQVRNVTVITNKQCKRYLGFVNEFNFCTGETDMDKAESFRDAGGPVVEGNKLSGIVSYFFQDTPGLQARLYKYLSWIKKTIK